MKKKKILDVVFILDKSGSMAGSEDHTISSFNEYLESEKKNNFDTRITTVLFSNTYNYLYERKFAKNVKPLTKKDYYVGGCTALYDALGNSINRLEQEGIEKALFIIITDGYENASKEYNKEIVSKLIKKHKEWEFIYIGADIDSFAAGGDIGIKKDRIASYRKDKKGTSTLFKAVGMVECAMMEDKEIDNSWKKELDSYIEKNKD